MVKLTRGASRQPSHLRLGKQVSRGGDGSGGVGVKEADHPSLLHLEKPRPRPTCHCLATPFTRRPAQPQASPRPARPTIGLAL
ncbi:hypothetical protein E2C01_085890 [Portunus trituberculatus]|uniref:Uncharacterized protein n=1 Tax=Portunus trituberculatus TaxID=210409 RepID=A0A5B7JA34_PORTR|nr:hypothetical protein [Portunus trituberculatus]